MIERDIADFLRLGEGGRVVHFDNDALQREAAERDVDRHAGCQLNAIRDAVAVRLPDGVGCVDGDFGEEPPMCCGVRLGAEAGGERRTGVGGHTASEETRKGKASCLPLMIRARCGWY